MARQSNTGQDGPGTALITGSSSGIGLELAKCFAADGHDVFLVGKDPEKLEKASHEVEAAGAPKVETLAIDLSRPDGAPRLWEEMHKRDIIPDFLVLNAGVGVWGDFVRETDLAEELKMIQLNVTTPMHTAKLFLRHMVERGSGRVLMTSSLSAIGPAPRLAVYSGTKAFLYGFAEAVRNELQDTGVTITALLPDITETDFFRRAGAGDSKTGQAKKADPAVVAEAGYQAMMKGTDHVVTPAMSKVKGAIANILPERLVATMARAD
jgi:short-subunit dehydrogenase